MDFLHKLKHGQDAEEEHSSNNAAHAAHAPIAASHTAAGDAPPAEQQERPFLDKLIAGSGSTHTTTTTTTTTTSAAVDQQHHHSSPSFLDKLGGSHSRAAREQRAAALAAREAELRAQLAALAQDKVENEGFFHSLRERFDKEAAHDKEQQEGEGETPGSFWDKFTGKEETERKARELAAREAALRAELAEVEAERREEVGLLAKLRDRLDGENEEEEEEEARLRKEKEEHGVSGFFDKLTGKSAKEEEEARLRLEKEHKGKDHGVSDFLDKITGKEEERRRRAEEEANKNPLEKMKDRLEEGMGGGRKAEEKEDFLDKTIDGFQEHVLHKGDQDDESALEQLKDEKIASLLRKQLRLKEEEEEKE